MILLIVVNEINHTFGYRVIYSKPMRIFKQHGQTRLSMPPGNRRHHLINKILDTDLLKIR